MSAVRFDEELCDGCGICFERCPEVRMDRDRARRAIRELIKRQGAKQELFDFIDTHPIIRSLSDYGELVRNAFEEVCV